MTFVKRNDSKICIEVSDISDWNPDSYSFQRQRKAINKTVVNIPKKFSLKINPSRKKEVCNYMISEI